MKTATIVSLAVSVLLGAGALLFGRAYIVSEKSEAAAAAVAAAPVVATKKILVFKSELQAGDAILPEHVGLADWPADSMPEGALTNVKDLAAEVYVRSLVLPGDAVVEGKLDLTGASRTLAGQIEAGYRAVSILVRNDTGVAGWVMPGDRVDVNVFRPVEETAARGAVETTSTEGETLLHNVRVLAVDQSAEVSEEGAVLAETITLEVTPDDGLKLSLAVRTGAIGLALIGRNEDKAPAAAEPAQPTKPTKASVRPRAAELAQPPESNSVVRVINGEKAEEILAPVVRPALNEGAR